MEDSSSDPFNSTAASRGSLTDYEDGDVLLSFQSLGLGSNQQERDIDADTQSIRRLNMLLMNQFNSDRSGWSSRSLGSHDNIWAHQDFTNNGLTQVPNLPYGQEGFVCSDHEPGNFSTWLRGETSINPYQRENILNHNQNFSDMAPNQCACNQFHGTRIRGCCSSYGNNSNNFQGSSSGLWNQNIENFGSQQCETHVRRRINDLGVMARTPDGSWYLQEILEQPDHEKTQLILEGVCLSIVELIADNYGRYVFDKLIEVCNDSQLNIILMALELNQARFVDAAFTINGANSIQRLIRKVKKTSHASTVTRILSIRFFELMTDHTGRFIIRQCLNHFGNNANEVLFEGAITYYMPLATHVTGCISLNECIDNITGCHRKKLLSLIADKSDHLSNDPYGNFVVQRVLSLRNEEITRKICERLRDLYIQLSLKKGGSHVVERCIEFSELGMTLAVEEILRHEKAALQLARDQFGNYVIQTALNRTKINNKRLYQSLVMALKTHHADLMRNRSGRHVLEMIKDEIQFS